MAFTSIADLHRAQWRTRAHPPTLRPCCAEVLRPLTQMVECPGASISATHEAASADKPSG